MFEASLGHIKLSQNKRRRAQREGQRGRRGKIKKVGRRKERKKTGEREERKERRREEGKGRGKMVERNTGCCNRL